MSWWSRLVLAAACGVISAVPAGAGAAVAPQAVTADDAATVSVLIKEWSFKASVQTVAAGKVTFVVRNAGKMPHEYLILRTDTPAKALKMRGLKAVETGAVGRIGAFAAGSVRRLTVNLQPGKYVLLCNMAGHYKAGQAIGFVVTRPATVVAAAQTTRVAVSGFEMGFKLSRKTVPRGTVIFDVVNDGKLPHDFSFGSKGGGTKMLGPGQRDTLTVSFPRPGQYTFICTVEGHMEGGMIGVLTVT